MATNKKETPVAGSVALEGELSPALGVLLARLDQMEQTNRLLAVHLAEMKTTQDAALASLKQEIVAEKERSEQALQAAMERLQKVMEQKPKDPAVQAVMTTNALEEAKKQSVIKKARFEEYLKTAPTRTVISHEPGTIALQINGVQFLIKPGRNKKVPKPFADLWDEMQDDREYAAKREAVLRNKYVPFGNLEAWIDEGREGDVPKRVLEL